MADPNLILILTNAQSADKSIRDLAESELVAATQNHYAPFIVALTGVFTIEGTKLEIRTLAGIYLKNLVTAEDEHILQTKSHQWDTCDLQSKAYVKASILNSLLSPEYNVRHTAASVLAAFGSMELPKRQWPEFLKFLLNNIVNPRYLLIFIFFLFFLLFTI